MYKRKQWLDPFIHQYLHCLMHLIRMLVALPILILQVGASLRSDDVQPRNPSIQLSDELIIHSLSGGVFLVTHAFPWPCNSLIVQSGNGDVYLVDTPCSPEATERIVEWTNSNLNPTQIVAIVTGFHIDNLGGVSCLIENGITVHGSDLTVHLLDTDAKRSHDAMLPWL